jgi:hypothetical protein
MLTTGAPVECVNRSKEGIGVSTQVVMRMDEDADEPRKFSSFV